MTSEAIAIITATFLGPIFAVIVTLWYQRRAEQHQRRTYIFRTLMSTRRLSVSREHVDALNLIEVDFHGVKKVQEAHKHYLTHLNNGNPDKELWVNTRHDLLAKLLHALSVEMDMPIGEIDLRNGGYSPVAWAAKDQVENYIIQVIEGKEAVPIRVVNIPPPTPLPPPSPLPQ